MSLTSHLDDKNSPIRHFLRSRFPDTRGFLKDARKRVREATTIRQTPEVPWTIIGTALDYRLRYYFEVTPFDKLVAYQGARRLTDTQSLSSPIQLSYRWTGEIDDPIIVFDVLTGRKIVTWFPGLNGGSGEGRIDETTIAEAFELAARVASGEGVSSNHDHIPLRREYKDFFKGLHGLIQLSSPVSNRLAMPEEDLLNRYCVVLALMEDVFRSGRMDGILGTGRFSDAEALTAIAEPHWIDDLRELSWRFYDGFNHLLPLPHVLNPTFDGSRDVGGADADLIVNGTLIDIKATVKQIQGNWAWQLLGYALLDYSDRHRITGIGLYMARQGIFFEWTLEEATRALSSGETPSIEELRAQFKDIAQKPGALDPVRA